MRCWNDEPAGYVEFAIRTMLPESLRNCCGCRTSQRPGNQVPAKKVKPARISVLQNGVPIHKGVEIPVDKTVAGLGRDPSKPGPIMLQDHGNPVQSRNIWLVPLKY